jgi:hypothetical protein
VKRPKFGKALPVATSQRLAFGPLTQPRPVVDPLPDVPWRLPAGQAPEVPGLVTGRRWPQYVEVMEDEL